LAAAEEIHRRVDRKDPGVAIFVLADRNTPARAPVRRTGAGFHPNNDPQHALKRRPMTRMKQPDYVDLLSFQLAQPWQL